MKNNYIFSQSDPREVRAANDNGYMRPELIASRQRAHRGNDPREIRAANDDSYLIKRK